MSAKLSPADLSVVREFSDKYSSALNMLEKAKQLNIGDYLVLYLTDHDGKKHLQVNSYGAPIKYMVVHASEHGIPFLKKVNKKGRPVGQLYSCLGNLTTDSYKTPDQKFQFELDPDFADSLILQDGYDPATIHKTKQEIWKAVTEHNKKNRIHTSSLDNIINFFQTLNVGDTIWSSAKSHFMVRDKKSISKADAYKTIKSVPHHKMKGPFVLVLTVVDKNGKVKDIAADYFYYKALYKERPRSYSELKI